MTPDDHPTDAELFPIHAAELHHAQLLREIEALARVRDDLNRTPAARHVSVAITHLEDAELRLQHAIILARAERGY